MLSPRKDAMHHCFCFLATFALWISTRIPIFVCLHLSTIIRKWEHHTTCITKNNKTIKRRPVTNCLWTNDLLQQRKRSQQAQIQTVEDADISALIAHFQYLTTHHPLHISLCIVMWCNAIDTLARWFKIKGNCLNEIVNAIGLRGQTPKYVALLTRCYYYPFYTGFIVQYCPTWVILWYGITDHCISP